MLKKTHVFPLILSFLAFGSCTSLKVFPEKYQGEQIHFGQGGGFSGVLTYYILLDDGRLYQRGVRDSSFAAVGKWPAPFVKQIFSNYEFLKLADIDYNEPGDLYYFIQYQSGDQLPHLITWGRPGFNPEGNLVTYYNLLYKSTKSKS